jgi:hypothetical protein
MSEDKVVNIVSARAEMPGVVHAAVTIPIEMEQCDVHGALATGFRINWITADSAQMAEATLDVGAGCGSPWMMAYFKLKAGQELYYRTDMRKFFELLATAALHRAEQLAEHMDHKLDTENQE